MATPKAAALLSTGNPQSFGIYAIIKAGWSQNQLWQSHVAHRSVQGAGCCGAPPPLVFNVASLSYGRFDDGGTLRVPVERS